MDRRTLQNAVVSGDIGGWARPGLQRLRWYVYEDQLPAATPSPDGGGPQGAGPAAADDVAGLRGEVAELRAQVELLQRGAGGVDVAQAMTSARDELRVELAGMTESAVADLRADIVTLRETNLLLLEAQEELGGVATTLDSVAQKYRRALALFMTPGHPGELTR
ncbi:hypothetical protein MycrhDRAFT_6361 [Mycolicibacterium rhodesiae JS60]|nr:hypothetical protein MycrhDRAFT_6361 [Mycolicibacterium rhodesiae JS60]